MAVSRRYRRSSFRFLLAALTVGAVGVGPGVGSAAAADPVFAIENATANEGEQIVFTVTCTDPDGQGVNDECPNRDPDIATSQGTAADPEDYDGCALPDNYCEGPDEVFGATPDFVTKTFDTVEDSIDENDETFTVTLFNNGGDIAIGTIVDDDGPSNQPPGPAGNADLAVGKTESADPARVGDTLVYTLAVHNFGPSSAGNVTLTDVLPGNVTFVSAAPTFPGQGACSFNGTNLVTCSIGTIAANTTHFFEVRVVPNSAGTIQNTASASSSSNLDPLSGNNSATAITATFLQGTTPPPPVTNPGTGPIASLGGTRVCSWSEGSCVVIVDCANLVQDCTAVGTGRVVFAGRAVSSASVRFRRVRRSVLAGEEEELAFRVGARGRRAIRRALRRGRRVRARVRVVVTDEAGNRTVRRRTLRITP